MRDTQESVTKTHMRTNNKKLYVDKNFIKIEQSLIGLIRHMTIANEIAKNWNRMQGELQSQNQEMAAFHELHMALMGLLHKIGGEMED